MKLTNEQVQELSFLIDDALYGIAEANNLSALDISSITLARLMLINATAGSINDFRHICLTAVEHGVAIEKIDLDKVTLQ